MRDGIRLVEVNYHHHEEYTSPQDVISKHRPSNLILEALQDKMEITLVKHAAFEGVHGEGALRYRFFKGKNGLFHIPFRANRFISQLQPDIVLVQGFIFPLHVMHLRYLLGKKASIILQHQGDLPGGKKKWLQRKAGNSVNGYFFRSRGNTVPWLKSNIISQDKKVFETADASTWFTPQPKNKSRAETGMKGSPVFLWVGRLDDNKDPLTVLNAFASYAECNIAARLYMLYEGGNLEGTVKDFIKKKDILRNCVVLPGKIDHNQMEKWYSAADYFILASHHEGGSYALTEAMACGCIPVVSAIPPSLQMTGHGATGYSFPVGDHVALAEVLKRLNLEKIEIHSEMVKSHFQDSLSPTAIASRLFTIFEALVSKNNAAIASTVSLSE